MIKTKFYVPALYFRNFLGAPVVHPEEFVEAAVALGDQCTAVELIIDENLFDVYTDKMEWLFQELSTLGISVPIVRILSPSLYDVNCEEVLAPLEKVLSRVEAFFGPVAVQLDNLSAWQTYEIRNNTMIHPDNVPPGYRYATYAGYVLKAVDMFCEVCTKVGHTPVIEPRTGHVISSPDSVMRILEKSEDGKLPFKVIFDVTHMEFQGINTVDAWSVLKEHAIAVHASDTDVVNGHHLPIGDGNVPWKSILTYTARQPDVNLIAVEMLGGEHMNDPEMIKSEYLKGLATVKRLISNYGLTESFE